MSRWPLLACLIAFGTWSLACTTGGTRGGDADFRLRKAETERDQLAQQLQSERARSTILDQELQAEQTRAQAARAEAARFRESLDTLTKANQQLEDLLHEASQRPLERPTVPASPLPAELDRALQTLVAKLPGRVWYDRGRGALSFANDRLFDPGSAVVRPDSIAGLQELAATLRGPLANGWDVIVAGHTDDAPITKPETLALHASNWHLSVHRAIAVLDVLLQGGMPPERCGVMGFAQFRPISGDPVQNRRVEVHVVRRGAVRSFEPVRPAGGSR